jgi:hypothetical protein
VTGTLHILERVRGDETKIERSFHRTQKERQKIHTPRLNAAEASALVSVEFGSTFSV